MDLTNYKLQIEYEKYLDYTQSIKYRRIVTLFDTSKQRSIIFRQIPVYQAHKQLYDMGLEQLAKENNI